MTRRLDSRTAGFTLTELLIVILIIAVLIGVLLPAIGGARVTARKSATVSFMNEVLGASAQFQAAERRLPGYFSVRELGSTANYAKGPADSTRGGLTQMESALIDLAGGVDPDQSRSGLPSPLYNPNTEPPDRIEVGIVMNSRQSVILRRSLIGSADGPGYLAMPEQFVDPGSRDNGQVGSPAHRLMPDLVDAFGMPILMWQRDPLASQGATVRVADRSDPPTSRFPLTETEDPHFFLTTNCGMLHAERLGKGVDRRPYNDSCLAWALPGATNSLPQALQTLSAVVGHPAFPNAESMNPIGSYGPIPGQARGDIVMHSAGADGIWAKRRGTAITRIQYLPEGFSFSSGTGGWLEGGDFLEKFDDIILPGG